MKETVKAEQLIESVSVHRVGSVSISGTCSLGILTWPWSLDALSSSHHEEEIKIQKSSGQGWLGPIGALGGPSPESARILLPTLTAKSKLLGNAEPKPLGTSSPYPPLGGGGGVLHLLCSCGVETQQGFPTTNRAMQASSVS